MQLECVLPAQVLLQGLDVSTLGVFVSCLCATGIEQKVLARKAS